MDNILRVVDIDWSDKNIFRAGIIPLYKDGNYKYIGFGISNFSTNITTIGGSYESKDHDLLDTAIREYNEEVGNNLPPISIHDVNDCFAIITDLTIQILLPIDIQNFDKLSKFNFTEELYTMIWLTTRQLTALLRNDRFYRFSKEIPTLEQSIVFAIDNNIPFNIVSTKDIPTRSLKLVPSRNIVVKDISLLQQQVRSNFGAIILTATVNFVGIFFDKGVVFILPLDNLSLVLNIFYSEKCWVITDLEENTWPQDSNSKKIRSLDKLIPDEFGEKDKAIKDMREKIDSLKLIGDELEYIIELLTFLSECERKVYELKAREKICFDRKKACSIDVFNKVNQLLHTESLTLNDIYEKIGTITYFSFRGTKQVISVKNLVDSWINIGTLLLNPTSMLVSINR